jgi:hypothetical protein
MLSTDGLKNQFAKYFVVFPSEPVRIGESWTSSEVVTFPLLGSVTTNRTFTFKGMSVANEVDLARIDMLSDMSHRPAERNDDPDSPMQGAKVELSEGTGSGELWFDPVKGLPVRKVTTDAMTQKITSNLGGRNTVISQQIERTTTVEYRLVPSDAAEK